MNATWRQEVRVQWISDGFFAIRGRFPTADNGKASTLPERHCSNTRDEQDHEREAVVKPSSSSSWGRLRVANERPLTFRRVPSSKREPHFISFITLLKLSDAFVCTYSVVFQYHWIRMPRRALMFQGDGRSCFYLYPRVTSSARRGGSVCSTSQNLWHGAAEPDTEMTAVCPVCATSWVTHVCFAASAAGTARPYSRSKPAG